MDTHRREQVVFVWYANPQSPSKLNKTRDDRRHSTRLQRIKDNENMNNTVSADS